MGEGGGGVANYSLYEALAFAISEKMMWEKVK
jgi:hypothetical protein